MAGKRSFCGWMMLAALVLTAATAARHAQAAMRPEVDALVDRALSEPMSGPETDRDRLLAALRTRLLADEPACAALSAAELARVDQALLMLGASMDERRKLAGNWLARNGDAAPAADIVTLLDLTKRIRPLGEMGEVRQALVDRARKLVAPAPTENAPIEAHAPHLQLAAAVALHLDADARQALLNRLETNYAQAPDLLEQLDPDAVLALGRAISDLRNQPGEHHRERIISAWIEAGGLDRRHEPRQMIHLTEALSWNRQDEDIAAARARVAEAAFEQHLQGDAWLDRLDSNSLRAFVAIAEVLPDAQRQQVADDLQARLIDQQMNVRSLSDERLATIWRVADSLGLTSEDQGQFIARWLEGSLKLKNDLTADELDAVLRVASAAQTQLADDEQIVALGAQAVKLAMARVDLDRLSLQDFLRLQALVLQLSDKTDDGIGFTARWVTASDQHQRADFYQTHQLITLLRQGKGRTVNTALDRLAAHRQSALAGMYYKTFGAVRDQLVHESGRTGDQAAQYRAELTAEYLLAGEMWHLESYEALGAIHEDVLAHGDGKQIAAARLVLRDGRDKPLGRMPFNQFMTFLRRTADPAAMPEEAATYVAGYVIGGDEWRSLDYATQLDLRALLDKGRGDKVNVARTVMADQLPRTFRDQRLGQLGHYLRSGRAEIKSPQVREELIVRYVLESDRWRESDFPGMVELVHWLEGNEHDDQPKAVDRVLTHVRKSLENYAAPDDSGTSLGLRIENPRNHSGVIREILELVVGQLTDDGKAAVMAGVQRRFAIDVQRRIQFGDWETHLWAIVVLRLNNFGGQLAALEPQAAEKLLIASGGHPSEGSGGGPLMAMVLGKSFSAYGDREQWKALIRSKISDQSIVGDDRVIWHLAGAYMDETEGGATATPLSGWPLLQTAFAAAQSEYWRLQCINWMVSRRLAVQQYDEAKSLIQSVRQQFDTDSAQAQFDHLAKLIEVEREIEAERLEKVTRQLQRVRAKARLDIYSAELAKAREQNRGPADIEHLERLVSRFEQQLAELDSAAGD